MDGQILEGSAFALAIENIIMSYRPSSIVEIGTWKGLGSTKRVIDSIIKYKLSDVSFMSLESNFEFYNIAKNNLSLFSTYVNLLYGRIVNISDIVKFLQVNPIEFDDQYRWLLEDVINAEKCPYIMDQIPQNIELLILDGGEFSTYTEWKILKDRSKYIILDDTNVTKCREIKNEIINNLNIYQIIDISDERNGFIAIENIKYDK